MSIVGGFNRPGFKKCKVCEKRIRTDEIRCPCCKASLGAWDKSRSKPIATYL